jgi:hypothetical protein
MDSVQPVAIPTIANTNAEINIKKDFNVALSLSFLTYLRG